jgi:hypothetical protein
MEFLPEDIWMRDMVEISLPRELGPVDIPISDKSVECPIDCRPMVPCLTRDLRDRHMRMFEERDIDGLPLFFYCETLEEVDIFFHMYYFSTILL